MSIDLDLAQSTLSLGQRNHHQEHPRVEQLYFAAPFVRYHLTRLATPDNL